MPRLGEILLAEKLITSRELDTALENHVLHGVKLGTCVVEMGFVNDEGVASCLGKQTGCGFMSKDQLLQHGFQNISLISPAAIKKQRLIPVGISGATLRIATDHEISPKKIHELEQFLGRKIEPVMVSGYALDCFLEKMFGIQRPGRFLQNYSRVKVAAPVSTPAIRESRPQETSLVIDGVEWKNLDAVTNDEDYTQKFSNQFSVQMEGESVPITLSDLSKRLAHAASRDDVARHALEYLAEGRQVAALLIIKDMNAHGWGAVSGKKKVPSFKDSQFAIPGIPGLYQTVTTQQPFWGDTDTPELRALLKAINYDSCNLAFFPVSIQQHVAAVLLCDRSETFNIEEAAELSRKISYALSILILKSKLLR